VNARHRTYAGILLLIILAAVVHTLSPNIPDSDSFFYIKNAFLYRTEGLSTLNAEWLPYSLIHTLTASSWFGFAVVLMPFTLFQNLTTGIKVAGIILTALVLLTYTFVAKRHELPWPHLLPILFIFSAPNVLYRMLMMRPQLISLALGIVLVSLLSKSLKSKYKNLTALILTTTGIAWIHFNFVWLPLIIFGAVAFSALVLEKRLMWREGLAVITGALIGWIARPEFVNAGKLLYFQLIDQTLQKGGGAPLLFGSENFPLSNEILLRNFSPFMVLWGGALILLVWSIAYHKSFKGIKDNLLIWSTGLLSMAFAIVSITIARRGYDFWTAFGVLFLAAVMKNIIPELTPWKNTLQKIAKGTVITTTIFLVAYSGIKTARSLTIQASPPNRMQEVGMWLDENSEKGDIVFNVNWSHFSPLFFWSHNVHYIGGLDPIFQYAFDEEKYWQFHYLSIDEVTNKTCGAPACTTEMLENTYDVLVENFNARFVVLDKRQNPTVHTFLESDARFENVFETEHEIIYGIMRT
jgi:hypothetical protein